MKIDERGFVLRCGDCKKWQPISDVPGLGSCPVTKQNRHSKRELCKDEWEREAMRIGKKLGHGSRGMLDKLDRGLDPLRAWAVLLKIDSVVHESLKPLLGASRSGKVEKAQNEPEGKSEGSA